MIHIIVLIFVVFKAFPKDNLFIQQKNLVFYPVALNPDSICLIGDNVKNEFSFPLVIDIYPNYFFEKIIETVKDSSRTFYEPISDFSEYCLSSKASPIDYETLLKNLGKITLPWRASYRDETSDDFAKWNSITEINFIEDWVIDTVSNHFYKKIQAIEPVSERFDNFNEKYVHTPVAGIYFNYSEKELEAIKEKAVLSKRVKYEFMINRTEEEAKLEADASQESGLENKNAPCLNPASANKLINHLFYRANNRTFTPYSFHTMDTLTINDVWDIGKCEIMSKIEIYPGVFQDTTMVYRMQAEEIKSLVFIEDWYYSKEPFMIFKDVIGIAPVRHYIANYGQIRKDVPFVIYFDENKKF